MKNTNLSPESVSATNSQVNIYHNYPPSFPTESAHPKDQSISLKSIKGNQNQVIINNYSQPPLNPHPSDLPFLPKKLKAKDEIIAAKNEAILMHQKTIQQLEAEVDKLKSMLKLFLT